MQELAFIRTALGVGLPLTINLDVVSKIEDFG
jgi:hypothetical protein